MTDEELRELVARGYERQLSPKHAAFARGGIRNKHICAALCALKLLLAIVEKPN